VAFSPSGDYEISGWFKLGSTDIAQDIIDYRDSGGDGGILYIEATTSYFVFLHNSTSIKTTQAYDDDTWYRVVAGRTGSTLSLKIYNIEGTLAEAEITDTDATAIDVTTEARIGARSFTSPLAFLNGSLANIVATDNGTTIISSINADETAGQTLTGTSLVRIPQGIIGTNTNPSGKYHNGAETFINTNPFADPELIYRSGIEADHEMHPSEAFSVPEFFNNSSCNE
jgi:hypothetical protein